jgi:DnaK suppressor protein
MPKKPVKKPVVKDLKKSSKKRYIPGNKEKYMCAKHKKFFTEELLKWKKDIINSNSLTNILNSSDDNMSSADMVDQASSYTDKSVEMKALARSRKLIEKIESALRKIKDDTYGYCEETSEPIGLKRLIARPIATLSIEAQERHERDEKIFIEG